MGGGPSSYLCVIPAEPIQGSYEYDCVSPLSKFKLTWESYEEFKAWQQWIESTTWIKYAPARREKRRKGQQYLWKRRYACAFRPKDEQKGGIWKTRRDAQGGQDACPSVLILKAYPETNEVRGHISTMHTHGLYQGSNEDTEHISEGNGKWKVEKAGTKAEMKMKKKGKELEHIDTDSDTPVFLTVCQRRRVPVSMMNLPITESHALQLRGRQGHEIH